MKNEWQKKTIRELATVSRGASPRPIASSRWFDMQGDIGWVRIADVNRSNGRELTHTTQKLSRDGVIRSRYLEPGSLILSIAASVGIPAITTIPTCIHDGFVSLTNLKIDKKFLFYLLKKNRNRLLEGGQSGSQTNVNSDIVRQLDLWVPLSEDEQKRIASVLWSVDNLIDLLMLKVEKKRAIQQGLMQGLLTGKTRLSGFTREWISIPVAKLSHIKARIGWQGLTTSEYLESGTYRLVGGTDFLEDGSIDWAVVPFVSKWRYSQDLNIQLRPNDVLITKDGTIGKVAIVNELPHPTTLNSGVYVIRPKGNAYDPRFMFWMLKSSAFDTFINSLSAGSTINHLYQKDLVSLSFMVPKDLAEQTTIANVMDATQDEINILEKQLESTKAIKQGMMQELLSGRTCLLKEK